MAPLPELSLAEFGARLAGEAGAALPPAAVERLHLHYRELRRWDRAAGLLGPREAPALLRRHYGESLAALQLLPPGPARLLDVGSGAGFPGLVLALVRPDLEVTLVEPRGRKWAFLLAVARAARLPVACVDGRVERPLPAGLPERVEVVTARAVRLAPEALEEMTRILAPGCRLLLWAGAATPAVPGAFRPAGEHALPGARRRILEWRYEPPGAQGAAPESTPP